MSKNEFNEQCCDPNLDLSNCKIDAIVSVDERGQMLLPKDVRNKAKIRAGDKLAVISWEKNGEVYCISLIKTEGLIGMVKTLLEPIATELTKK
ncbi:MAG: HgcAB-associated protein HgcC [Methanobacterium sp.]